MQKLGVTTEIGDYHRDLGRSSSSGPVIKLLLYYNLKIDVFLKEYGFKNNFKITKRYFNILTTNESASRVFSLFLERSSLSRPTKCLKAAVGTDSRILLGSPKA